MQKKVNARTTIGSHIWRVCFVILAAVALDAVAQTVPVINLTVGTPDISEPNPVANAGRFVLHRTGPTNEALAVNVTFSGTATLGLDYDANEVFQFEPGQIEGNLWVLPYGDNVVETEETITAEVAPGINANGNLHYLVSTNEYRGTIKLHDATTNPPPVVSIEATDASATESGDAGKFTFSRTGPTNTTVTIYFTVSGTATLGVDYTANTNVVNIAAGHSTAERFISPILDDLIEGDESIAWRIVGSPKYTIDANKTSGTITLHDSTSPPPPTNVVVSIEATDPDALESGDPGVFTIRRTGPTNTTFTVVFGMSGTATLGTDYTANTNYITFNPGQAEATRYISPHADSSIEGNETVTWQLFSTENYAVDPTREIATITIHDTTTNPPPNTNIVVSIEATHAEAAEPTPDAVMFAELTLRRTGPTDADLPISLRYSGTASEKEYIVPANPIVIPAGSASTSFLLKPVADSVIEGDERLAVVIKVGPYSIDPERGYATITIHDTTPAPPASDVVLSVVATMPDAAEPSTKGLFTVHRTGPTNNEMMLYYRFTGSAILGRDYTAPTNYVFALNQSDATIYISPIDDDLVEGNETVKLTLVNSTIYTVDTNKTTATVTIHDAPPQTNRPPVATIVKPVGGAVFKEGDAIEIVAEGSDPNGDLKMLEIFGDGYVLGSGETNRLVVHWTNAPVGTHQLAARATDRAGLVSVGTNTTIRVRERFADSFVSRNLPDTYIGGAPFRVELRAEPPSGTHAYAVEDAPPQGWTVSDVSSDGYFDPATGKVKFGPFTDAAVRTLTYIVAPPANALGSYDFAGDASVDGENTPIGGDQTIAQAPAMHPADVKPADWRIGIDELTAYAAAWKASTNSGIPLSYVTRAGFLWKHGEAYTFQDPPVAPPFCWIPATTNVPPIRVASEGTFVRFGADATRPGVAAQVTISSTPAAGAAAVGIDEQVPAGWTVSNVSDGGVFDANASTIRWGVFYDSNQRDLHYTVTPPANVVEVGHLRGIASTDGLKQAIEGQARVVSVDDSMRPRLVKCERQENSVRVGLSGQAGQVSVLQRSTDLRHWQDVTTLFLPDGSAEYVDESAGDANAFYRLVVR